MYRNEMWFNRMCELTRKKWCWMWAKCESETIFSTIAYSTNLASALVFLLLPLPLRTLHDVTTDHNRRFIQTRQSQHESLFCLRSCVVCLIIFLYVCEWIIWFRYDYDWFIFDWLSYHSVTLGAFAYDWFICWSWTKYLCVPYDSLRVCVNGFVRIDSDSSLNHVSCKILLRLFRSLIVNKLFMCTLWFISSLLEVKTNSVDTEWWKDFVCGRFNSNHEPHLLKKFEHGYDYEVGWLLLAMGYGLNVGLNLFYLVKWNFDMIKKFKIYITEKLKLVCSCDNFPSLWTYTTCTTEYCFALWTIIFEA